MTTSISETSIVDTKIDPMTPKLLSKIHDAQLKFANLLQDHVSQNGADIDQYVRYLTMQYHLTKEVARYFLVCAAHPSMIRKCRLRKFLIEFSMEEELHYLIAARDLKCLDREVLAEPLDVRLWHVFFRSVIEARPFLRLGAACVLENISGGPARSLVKTALRASYMTVQNTRFLSIHQHEDVPHGDQILEAIARDPLTIPEREDLIKGAEIGAYLYLRMAHWALTGDGLLIGTVDGCDTHSLTSREEADISEISTLVVGDQVRLLSA